MSCVVCPIPSLAIPDNPQLDVLGFVSIHFMLMWIQISPPGLVFSPRAFTASHGEGYYPSSTTAPKVTLRFHHRSFSPFLRESVENAPRGAVPSQAHGSCLTVRRHWEIGNRALLSLLFPARSALLCMLKPSSVRCRVEFPETAWARFLQPPLPRET